MRPSNSDRIPSLPIGLWAVSGARPHDRLSRAACGVGRFRYSDMEEAGATADAYVI